MPLSEQEQRLLEEMERSLYHNDADFVAAVSARRGKPSYSVVAIGVLVGILGVAALLTGVIIHQIVIGVLGFVIMFAGVLIAVTPTKRGGRSPQSSSGPDSSGDSRHGSFMQNLGDRWEKRQDERDE
jgi:hypothetical protein